MLGILLAATVAASPAPPSIAHPLPCPAAHPQKTADRESVGPRKLGDLPDGQFYHAIWKEAGGCPIDEVWQNGRWVDRWTGSPPPKLRDATGDRR
jgi:xanthosine utilization system XapX-like protein